MKILSIPIPEGLPQALKMPDEEFQREVRRLLAAKLYELGKVSLGVAAEIAGMDRLSFLTKLEWLELLRPKLKEARNGATETGTAI